MIDNNTLILIDRLKDLKGSTTFFLQECKGENIKVLLLSQIEEDNVIIRRVKLFFDSPQKPVLYCESYLLKDNLEKEEFNLLCKGEQPIGKIFREYDIEGKIRKGNITLTKGYNEAIAQFLNVESRQIFKKEYAYDIGGRVIGQIKEFFNPESLGRI